MEPLEVLRSNPLLALLADAELSRLRRRSITRHWKRGEAIFRRGDPCVGVYAVVSGSIMTEIESESGKTQALGTYGPGAFLGSLAAIDGGGYQVTAMAREASCALLLTRHDFKAAVEKVQDWRERLIALLCNELRNNLQHFESMVFLDVSTRLARLMLFLRQNHAIADESPPVLRFSQREIADLLGCTREWVGKELGKWRDAGIIDIGRSHIVVRNTSALEQLAAARRRAADR